jgi:hypothetical protein
LDTYKRGAFLEKTDRFSKDVPGKIFSVFSFSCTLNNGRAGLGTYDTNNIHTKAMTNNALKQSAAERYAALQRKLDDLERIHAEGKKSVSTNHNVIVFHCFMIRHI